MRPNTSAHLSPRRRLPRSSSAGIALPEHDFWLFDGRLVQFNVFDDAGRWIRTDQTEEPVAVAGCVRVFDEVWERAVPHEKFSL